MPCFYGPQCICIHWFKKNLYLMSMLNANNTPYVRRIKDLLDDLFRMDKIHVFKKYAKMLTSRKMFQKRKKHGQNKTTLWAIH